MKQEKIDVYLESFIKLMNDYAERRIETVPSIQMNKLLKHITADAERDLRHAIADQLSKNAIESGMATKILFEPKAYEIAMNICAV